MTKRIFRSILAASLAALTVCLAVTLGVLYGYFSRLQAAQLENELTLAAEGTERGGDAYLSGLSPSGCRLTWVAADGTVLYDSEADAAAMENHAAREEIREALATGHGASDRTSQTLTDKTLYRAARLADGTVLRVSVSHASVIALLLGTLWPLALAAIPVALLCAALARRMAARIVGPLNALDLDHPLENSAYEELSPLLGRLNHQQLQITAQMEKLRRSTEELLQIAGNMREGLVLLDASNRIVSINPAARTLLGATENAEGSDFLTVERSPSLGAALSRAVAEGHAEMRLARGGRTLQFDISRIESDGAAAGAVLLVFDATELEAAERSRREFTANVSHELKTPLQTISGSAELIENGLVASADLPRFAARIRAEAARLIALIEDIIRLSQLDEGSELPREHVELLDTAREAAAALRQAAEKKGIALTVEGDSAPVDGVRRLLFEVAFNLCDNAVKYGRAGGSVTMRTAQGGGRCTLTVTDDGIGIPKEEQSRIFERFYRVDKSRSKASGGTGLGLSIVKHAVQLHGGSISLESAPGAGTTVFVSLPAASQSADFTSI